MYISQSLKNNAPRNVSVLILSLHYDYSALFAAESVKYALYVWYCSSVKYSVA
jgi:hypothetical protein